MATSPANSTNLTQDQLAKWLIEDAPYKIQIARVWPFMGIQGGKISYARTAALESLANIDDMATILGDGATSGITVQTADPDNPNTTFTLGELATRYKIDYSSMDRFKVPNNLDAVESALAIRRLMYMYFRKLDLGTTGGNGDFPSLADMAVLGNVVTSAGASLDTAGQMEELQQTYNLVTANNGRPTAIMCNSRALRYIVSTFYGLGANLEYVDAEWTDPTKGTVRVPQIAINGTPVYVNDMIATVEDPGPPATSLTKIYFMVLGDSGEAGPTRGITGIVPGPLKDTMFIRRESSEPVAASSTSQINVDYTFPVATAMGSSGALAILEGVDVVDFA
ncbi:MAG: hypothetical protein KDB68_05065 [Planctomycetes bacterium]|nr:hypothetical protein [Planctomycetota bacterium]MCA8935555.1 hypothetical protein [Planctomycetota bacterium]MCA8946962.1 hypothetical protein [Planctomycetota bacterium]